MSVGGVQSQFKFENESGTLLSEPAKRVSSIHCQLLNTVSLKHLLLCTLIRDMMYGSGTGHCSVSSQY